MSVLGEVLRISPYRASSGVACFVPGGWNSGTSVGQRASVDERTSDRRVIRKREA